MRAVAIIAIALAACGSEGAVRHVDVERATPDYGPLVGGTVIALHGSGFGSSVRVLIGGREAPLVSVVDDAQLEVVIPPGEQPGDAEVVVFDASGFDSARGIFHYSTAPSITTVSPANLYWAATDTVVTVTGSGFLDEGASELQLLVGRQPIPDVTIESDTTLTFVAPPGRPFARPTLELVNTRGHGVLPHAFRYTPGVRPGLLLFPRWGGSFAVFYDPVDHTTLPISALSGSVPRVRTVMRDDAGEYLAIDIYNQIGRLDLDTQTLTAVVPAVQRTPAIARVGDQVLGIVRYLGGGGRIGTLDLTTGAFSPVGTTSLFCCGSYGIAFDGSTVWFTARQDATNVYLNTFDPATGTVGTPTILAGGPGFRVEELRAWNGTLYATSTAGTLVSLDPGTGAVTTLTTPAERYSALDVFE
jgi:hypothetical protein